MDGEARSLDISEPQVALEFADDPVRYHHRLLLVPLGGGRHIAVSPDWDLDTVDLNVQRVTNLNRNAPFPARIADQIYTFDPVSADEMERVRLEARGLARLLGASVTALVASVESCRWIAADPGHASFGTEVSVELASDPSRFLARGSSGLVDLDGNEGWVFCQNVAAEDEAEWRATKQTGPGRDERIEALEFVAGRRLPIPLHYISTKVRDIKRPVDFPMQGPAAFTELILGIEASGVGLGGFHNWWVTISGISPSSGVANEHKCIFEALRHGLFWDGLAGRTLALFEFLSRRVLMIHRAVKRNPKHPNFEGLEVMLSSALDESGGVVASQFDMYVSESQRVKANVMKQTRLMHEELEHEAKKGKPDASKKGKKGQAEAE